MRISGFFTALFIERVDLIVKNTMFRRVVCSALALSLSVSCFVPTAFAETDNSLGTADESLEALTGTDSIRQNSYSKYLKNDTSIYDDENTLKYWSMYNHSFDGGSVYMEIEDCGREN